MKKILVVDDNLQFLEMMKEALSDVYCVECYSSFKSPKDVVLKIEEYKPDMILLDINLESFSASDVLREMKKSFSKNIPVIVITATNYDTPTERFMKSEKNVVGFFSKLESIEVIKERINLILEGGK